MNELSPTIHKVAYYETDRMQCTHHSNYIRFMEEARIDFFDRIGWGYAKMEQEGIMSPVISVSGEYKKMTTFPQEIEIKVRVISVRPAKILFGYRMYVDGDIVFEGTSGHCFMKTDGGLVTLKRQYPDLYALLLGMQEE